jgi:protein arginine kinase
MLEMLQEKPAAWFAGSGPHGDIVVCCQGVLSRNLADFPFPERCTDEERRSVEERVLGVIETADFLARGQYCALHELTALERRFLVERNIISEDDIRGRGPRGVYISEDQCASVVLNGRDHITLRAISPGLQLESVWERLTRLDDLLAESLDYAFQERLGYLSASLDTVGTGLRLGAVVHLAGSVMTNKVRATETALEEQGHVMRPILTEVSDAHGDLFRISNRGTLGRSEEELIFHLRHCVGSVMSKEKAALKSLLAEGLCELEDRVGRALGIARRAHLLSQDEALGLLSSLRLGVAAGLLESFSVELMNELLVTSQRAHLQMKLGGPGDELALSRERASLFRSRFGGQ